MDKESCSTIIHYKPCTVLWDFTEITLSVLLVDHKLFVSCNFINSSSPLLAGYLSESNCLLLSFEVISAFRRASPLNFAWYRRSFRFAILESADGTACSPSWDDGLFSFPGLKWTCFLFFNVVGCIPSRYSGNVQKGKRGRKWNAIKNLKYSYWYNYQVICP